MVDPSEVQCQINFYDYAYTHRGSIDIDEYRKFLKASVPCTIGNYDFIEDFDPSTEKLTYAEDSNGFYRISIVKR